jgi:hypothetical protein
MVDLNARSIAACYPATLGLADVFARRTRQQTICHQANRAHFLGRMPHSNKVVVVAFLVSPPTRFITGE